MSCAMPAASRRKDRAPNRDRLALTPFMLALGCLGVWGFFQQWGDSSFLVWAFAIFGLAAWSITASLRLREYRPANASGQADSNHVR
jgi:hypothetical protein